MAKFTELPQTAQIGIVLALAVVGAVGYWAMKVKPVQEANEKDLITLKSKKSEVAQLAPYENKLAELTRQIDVLNQQLELQKRIVPDEKEVPSFITLVQAEAQKAGIEIRRYTLKPAVTHEFYSEQSFDVDVDGAYYSVLDFFERLSKTERIVNVANLSMAGLKGNSAAARGVRRSYSWGAHETVAANCTATTFFSTPKPAPTPAVANTIKK